MSVPAEEERGLSGKELLLLLLYAPTEGEEGSAPIRGRTRLTKMMFLLEEELLPELELDELIDEDSLPEFRAWKFGPFSKEVFDDIDFFKTLDFVQCSSSGEPAAKEEALERDYWMGAETVGLDQSPDEPAYSEYSEESFKISSLGQDYIREKGLWEVLDKRQREKIVEFKKDLAQAPLYAILRYVYNRYPELAEKSEIRDEI